MTQWISTGNFQIPASLGHLELRRLWKCHSPLKHGLTAVFTVPRDWIGHSKNAVACLALLPHHHFDLNQLWIYKSALRSAGSFFGDNNNYIPCICTVFFTCRSQETSSKQAASHCFPLLAAGKMRCREGKHQVCLKLGVRWEGWQQLGALWDLIQRRSHSCWPTLFKWIRMDCSKSNGEKPNGKSWINCFSFVLYLFLFSSKRNISWQPALSNWPPLEKGFLAPQAALWSKNVCIWPQKAFGGNVGTPDLWPNLPIPNKTSSLTRLVHLVWFIQPK